MKAFIIEQKITLMANQYRIFSADEAGEKQSLIGFAHQKRLAFRERFDIYTDETKQQVLFSIQARKVLDIAAKYDILDANGTIIGIVGKSFKASLLRSTWDVFTPDDESKPLFIAREQSLPLAIFRRVWGVMPYIGDLPFFLRYHFNFLRPGQDSPVGIYQKTTLLRDHYLLRAEDELDEAIDWRALVALGIMMDALQSR
jgi:uncharacterized protein YxjI